MMNKNVLMLPEMEDFSGESPNQYHKDISLAEMARTAMDGIMEGVVEASTAPVSQFKTSYYCGGQAEIYMGDILLDEVTALQFTTVTNRAPVYGYASSLFDAALAGNIIIQGTFAVNFVQANYLQILAANVKELQIDNALNEAVITGSDDPTITFELDLWAAGLLSMSSGWSMLDQSEGAASSAENFRRRQMINSIQGAGNADLRALSQKYRAARRQNKKTGQERIPRIDRIRPFTIYAVFGDYRDQESSHTVKTIKRVHLTNSSISVNSSGEPIQEVYEFFARDIG